MQSISEQLRESRKKHGYTQEELADLCRLDIRTIQRIESGAVSPRLYTIRIINEVLGNDIVMDLSESENNEELSEYRKSFQRRKTLRLILFGLALLVLILAAVLVLFSEIPKRIYAPFVYIIMFGILFGIGLTWRCPSCNGILGDVFSTRFCSKCGLKFYEK